MYNFKDIFYLCSSESCLEWPLSLNLWVLFCPSKKLILAVLKNDFTKNSYLFKALPNGSSDSIAIVVFGGKFFKIKCPWSNIFKEAVFKLWEKSN